ncbi:MAG: hypothetical protein DMD98_08000 [Candidatus Rokuibacteriota bacterium]|nr:MAG: hypothetical protein DMD98_08000 [Candidatus Rokubacteria bacterium]
MRPTFKKLQVKDIGNLEHLVAENIEGIEPGLRVIDSRVCLGHAAIDLIALDSNESLVLVALDFTADEGLLLRGMDAYSWSLEYPDTLRRLYPMANVSSTRPPRILFVVERLTEAFVRRIKQLSFLEIDCVEFRHLEVNGAPAVFFDLVVRLRREVTVEPTSNGQGAAATVPRRTPKQITGEAPSISPASPRLFEPRGVPRSTAPPTTDEPAPLASERPPVAAAPWAAPSHRDVLETRMGELFGKRAGAETPSATQMPTEAYATEETEEAADAEIANADVVPAEPARELESATAHQETRQAPSVSARVTASPEWEALLHQLGAAMPAPTRAEFTGRAAEAPTQAPVETNAAAVEEPASANQAGARLYQAARGEFALADSGINEAGARLRQATQGGSGLAESGTVEEPAPAVEEPMPAVEQPAEAPVDTAESTQTQPVWTRPSTDKVVQPTGRTYFFSQAAKSTTPAEVPEPKPAAAPAAEAATGAQKTVAPAQRVSASAQQMTAPVHPRPAAPARPPAAPAALTVAPAPLFAVAAATKVDVPKPTEPEPIRPGLEALSFPKDGLSRQWLEFLNQLGGAK